MARGHDSRCRCCTDAEAPRPVMVEDEPALSALVHEHRAHGAPRATLELALSRARILFPHAAPEEDPSIALVELLAYVGDLLSYYQNAVATEAYLETARTRRSLRELARLLDYELRPGLGLSAEVALLLEEEKGRPDELELPEGAWVRAHGTDGKLAATFRTIGPLDVRSIWSVLRPRGPDANDGPMDRNRIALRERVGGLPSGRLLLVHGIDADTDREAAEVSILETASLAKGVTTLTLAADLHHSYRRGSVQIHANVVRATHGETRAEVLGSGDASVSWQAFPLGERVADLEVEGSGEERVLQVRVDGVPWRRVETLRDSGPDDRVYLVANAPDGRTAILFGDGVSGARLPTGTENVTARYRTGAGSRGSVDAGSLSRLESRPAGLQGVTNPIPASGGEDPETTSEIRQGQPDTVRTFDRVVSLSDYEELARAFPGISRAQATRLWDGSSPIVHVTVASPDGTALDDDSAPLASLRTVIRSAADPALDIVVQSYAAQWFSVAGRVRVDASRVREDVAAAVSAALADAYSFARRDFGEAIEAAEVVAVIKRVEGVTAVELTAFHEVGGERVRREVLIPRPAAVVSGRFVPAELLIMARASADIALVP